MRRATKRPPEPVQAQQPMRTATRRDLVDSRADWNRCQPRRLAFGSGPFATIVIDVLRLVVYLATVQSILPMAAALRGAGGGRGNGGALSDSCTLCSLDRSWPGEAAVLLRRSALPVERSAQVVGIGQIEKMVGVAGVEPATLSLSTASSSLQHSYLR